MIKTRNATNAELRKGAGRGEEAQYRFLDPLNCNKSTS
jgi:hypothetical protein